LLGRDYIHQRTAPSLIPTQGRSLTSRLPSQLHIPPPHSQTRSHRYASMTNQLSHFASLQACGRKLNKRWKFKLHCAAARLGGTSGLSNQLAVILLSHVKSLPRISVSQGRSRRSRTYHRSPPTTSRSVRGLEQDMSHIQHPHAADNKQDSHK
jgi:hypothetical protein